MKSERAKLSALRNDFKKWLKANAPKAKVTGEYDISLNAVAVQLNGESLATVASSPLVVKAQPQYLYHPLDANDPDLNLISAIQAWGGGGAAGVASCTTVPILPEAARVAPVSLCGATDATRLR